MLERHDVDLWLTFVRETSLSKDPALELIYPYDLTWHSAFLVGRDGQATAIVGRYDAENVKRLNVYSQVIGYDESIGPALTEAIRGIAPGRVALNFSESDPAADGLTHGMKLTLDQILAEAGVPSDRVVSAEGVLESLRGQKTLSEAALIRQAIATTEKLFAEVGAQIRPGVSERALADFMHRRLAEMGLGTSWDWDFNPIVNTGPESVMGHAGPSDLVVRSGHLVHLDFGVKQDNYCSDIQRMWYVLDEGENDAPADVQRVWKLVRGALSAGAEALRPGKRGWEVDQAARQYLIDRGLPEYKHAFGHNVGRVAHDGGTTLGPRWERYGQSPYGIIEPGSVYAVELGAEVPGKGWIYLEENVLVTENGLEWLSTPQTEIVLVRT
ncbi:MAG: aminopeptidase P family protein [Chloroflexi bacterium]|nr:aminopeptidase P family protein [Chloroflexota bacterium]